MLNLKWLLDCHLPVLKALKMRTKSPPISNVYHSVWPPVSARLWPVMNALASDAMNTMAACTHIKH